MTPVTLDTAAVTRWLRQPCPDLPETTRADYLGVENKPFDPGQEGFRATISDILTAEPAGLRYRNDITALLPWPIPDGDVPDQGALITVDLAGGNRLATQHQDINDFAERRQRSILAAISAPAHIAGHVNLLLKRYQPAQPNHAPHVAGAVIG